MLYQLLATVPAKAAEAIVIFREREGFSCKWIGMSPEQAVLALYGMADEIVAKKIPLREWRPK